jgi:hypothetical protein
MEMDGLISMNWMDFFFFFWMEVDITFISGVAHLDILYTTITFICIWQARFLFLRKLLLCKQAKILTNFFSIVNF